MTHGAAGAVEERTEAIAGFFDLAKIFQAEAELLEFARRDAGQRIAGNDLRLPDNLDDRRHQQRSGADQCDEALHLTTNTARIAVWPAPHGREHSMMNVPSVSATYFTTVSPRRRLGIWTFTSVPRIRKP